MEITPSILKRKFQKQLYISQIDQKNKESLKQKILSPKRLEQ